MQDYGTILWFDPVKGYGFIRPDQPLGGGQNVFVHRNELLIPPPAAGARVTYELGESRQGWVAKQVRAAGDLMDVA